MPNIFVRIRVISRTVWLPSCQLSNRDGSVHIIEPRGAHMCRWTESCLFQVMDCRLWSCWYLMVHLQDWSHPYPYYRLSSYHNSAWHDITFRMTATERLSNNGLAKNISYVALTKNRPLIKASDAELSLICPWTNDWENNQDAGNLRRHRAHYDVIVMSYQDTLWGLVTHIRIIKIVIYYYR